MYKESEQLINRYLREWIEMDDFLKSGQYNKAQVRCESLLAKVLFDAKELYRLATILRENLNMAEDIPAKKEWLKELKANCGEDKVAKLKRLVSDTREYIKGKK